MWFLAIVAVLVAGGSTAYVASEEVRYLWRAGAEESEILAKRRPIEKLVSDSAVPAERRAQLQLVLDARDAAAAYGLDAGTTYRKFSDVGRDTLLLVLSASRRDCFCPHLWSYPIVGKVPYKGFFDAKMAQKAAAEFEKKGYDIYLRPSAAFSTLGWFEDPLLSTALTRDSVELASLVFHEIAHNSLYVKSATPFNESFAQLIGYRAAERFFRERGDSVHAQQAADRWHDEIILGAFYQDLVDRLRAFYDSKPLPAALDSGRVAIGSWAKEQLEGPVGDSLRTIRFRGRLRDAPVNNARLVGATIYRTHLDRFETFYRQQGEDVNRTTAALKELMKGATGDEAFERLEKSVRSKE